ncbi:13537_t:CDS:2 [Funneliformis geosporum]|uniref:13537_t:CDS:1 n=1 Tax=Funneliformis geosporum TaxID=1117311 RepID=A0A9W4SCI0_9GLOM|nr:13537_t:CDS:2 [Funneliformis geosporum]
MSETNKLKKGVPTNHQKKIVEKDEITYSKKETEKQLITLTGITTSQINQALKIKNPYPARVFLKVDNQEQDIPVFFRIKDQKGNYIRPKIKKGSFLQVQGHFSIGTVYTKQSERKSFTAYSYQLQKLNQQIESYGKKQSILTVSRRIRKRGANKRNITSYTLLETHLTRKDNQSCLVNCKQTWESIIHKYCQEKVLGQELEQEQKDKENINDYGSH